MRQISERCSLKLGSCYFALVADACILLFFSQWASTGWSEVALLLVDGLFLFSTAIATTSNISVLLLPNLIFRALLLTGMMFFTCFAVDSLLRPEDSLQILRAPEATTEPQLLSSNLLKLFFSTSSDSFQTELRRKIVENPQIAIACPFFCVLFIIEFKLFVQVWRNLQNDPPMTTPVIEKPPPPYAVCLKEDALPNYEQVTSSRSSSISRPRASISLAGKAPMPLPI